MKGLHYKRTIIKVEGNYRKFSKSIMIMKSQKSDRRS